MSQIFFLSFRGFFSQVLCVGGGGAEEVGGRAGRHREDALHHQREGSTLIKTYGTLGGSLVR